MNIKGVLKGTAVALIMCILFLFIGSVLIYFNLVKEQTVSVGLFAGILTGIFTGAFIAARNAFSRIIVNSLSVSLIFVIITVIASVAVNGTFSLHIRSTALIISSLAAGVLGAIAGRGN